jgi:hypothetical protein
LTVIGIEGYPSGGNAQPVIKDATGRGWKFEKHLSFDGGASGAGITLYSTKDGATGPVTIDFGTGQTQLKILWAVIEEPGAESIRQSVTGTGASLTSLATLAAFTSTANATLGLHGVNAFRTYTPGAGFTELTDQTDSSTVAMQTEFQAANDTTVDATISGAGTPTWGAIGAELNAVVSPRPNVQAIGADNGWQTAKKLVVPFTPTPGNTGILLWWGNVGGLTVVDNLGVTWTDICGNDSNMPTLAYYRTNLPAGISELTITSDRVSATVFCVALIERDDIPTTPTITFAINNQTTNTPWTTGATAVLPTTRHVIYAFCGSGTASAQYVAPFTNTAGIFTLSGRSLVNGIHDQLTDSDAFVALEGFSEGGRAITVTGTCQVGTSWQARVLAFKVLANIIIPPQSVNVDVGQTASFSIFAQGTGALSYQWKKNGSNVGTNSTSYSLTTAVSDNNAAITCAVTDDVGTITSKTATLTLS